MDKKNFKISLILIAITMYILYSAYNFVYNKVDYNSSQYLQKIQTFIADKISSHSYSKNMQLASKEFENNNYNEAIKYYTYAIKQKQDSSEAYYYRGLSEWKLDDDSKAVEDFKKTTELDPQNIDALYKHASLSIPDYSFYDYPNNPEFTKSVITAFCNLAIKELDKVIEYQPNNINAYLDKAIAKYRMGLFDDALKDLNNLLILSPNNSDIYSLIGTLFLDYVSYKEYEIGYNAEENRNLSQIYKNEYTQALINFNKAIVLDSKNEEAYFGRGLAEWNLKNYNEAIRDFNKVLSLDPEEVNARINIIYIKIDLAKYYRDKNKNYYEKIASEIHSEYDNLVNKYSNDESMSDILKDVKREIDSEEIYDYSGAVAPREAFL